MSRRAHPDSSSISQKHVDLWEQPFQSEGVESIRAITQLSSVRLSPAKQVGSSKFRSDIEKNEETLCPLRGGKGQLGALSKKKKGKT